MGNVDLDRYSKIQKSVFMYERLQCKFCLIPQDSLRAGSSVENGARSTNKGLVTSQEILLNIISIEVLRTGKITMWHVLRLRHKIHIPRRFLDVPHSSVAAEGVWTSANFEHNQVVYAFDKFIIHSIPSSKAIVFQSVSMDVRSYLNDDVFLTSALFACT